MKASLIFECTVLGTDPSIDMDEKSIYTSVDIFQSEILALSFSYVIFINVDMSF